MRIAIEAHSLTRRGSGITTYVRELLPALQVVGPEHHYEVLDRGPIHEALMPLWLNTTVSAWLRGTRADVVHFTKAALPFDFVQGKSHVPTVVTIHDVIPILFPQSQNLIPRLLWPTALRHAARAADHILTISETSKRDIVQHLHVPPEKVTATPLAVPSQFKVSAQRPLGAAEAPPYILFLATLEPRKNVPALIRSFSRIAASIPHKLIIAGRPYRAIDDIRRAIQTARLENRVEVREYVPAQQLPALYAGADLFVWPSIYEGWGFPPQEAMAAGTPVIVSNGGSLPEVVGGAGEVVPFTVDTIAARTHDETFEITLAERMHAVLVDPSKQSRMREAGLKQAQKNSWKDVAQATLSVYAKVALT